MGLLPGGLGRPSRAAGRASGTASNVTTGSPKVKPNRLVTAPPKEWPVNHTLASGYICVTLE